MTQTDGGSAVARRPRRHDLYAILAYAGLLVGTYVLGLGLGSLIGHRATVHPVVWEPILFPGLFLLAPPVVAVLNLGTGGTVSGSVAVGLVPGVAFTVLAALAALLGTGTGDSPLWALVLYLAGIGLAGTLTATAVSIFVERIGRSLTAD